MKITILGSTGFLGKVLLKRALDRGYQVRTLVRNPDKLGAGKDRVEFVRGDIFRADDLAETVAGTQAVLSTVGPPQKNPTHPEKYEQAMRDLVAAMQQHGITRLIHTGGAVHPGGEHERWTMRRRLLGLVLNLMWKPGLVAKKLEWDVLKQSDLEWTLVRPPRIATGPRRGSLVAYEKTIASIQVNVEDLADFMLDQIESREWIRKAPLVAAGR